MTELKGDAAALTGMLMKAGIAHVVDRHQRKADAPEGSFVLYFTQPPSRLNDRTWYAVFHFSPEHALVGFQLNE